MGSRSLWHEHGKQGWNAGWNIGLWFGFGAGCETGDAGGDAGFERGGGGIIAVACRADLSANCEERGNWRRGGAGGGDLNGGPCGESARSQWASAAARGGARGGEGMEIQAVSAEWESGGSGDDDYDSLFVERKIAEHEKTRIGCGFFRASAISCKRYVRRRGDACREKIEQALQTALEPSISSNTSTT